MTYFIISAICSAFASAWACLFVFISNSKSKINQIFAYYAFFVAWWSVFYFLWISSNNGKEALFYIRIATTGALFIPITFIHFTTLLLDKYDKYKKIIKILYCIDLLMIPIGLFTPWYIKELSVEGHFLYWPIAGSLYIIFVSEYFLGAIFCLYQIFKEIKTSSSPKKQQLKYLFWGIVIAFLGGATHFPYTYKIPFPPYGTILISCYSIFITYAIFKFQFMEINIILKRSLVYSLLITVITLFYFLSIYLTEHFFQEVFKYHSVFISLALASMITLSFAPLKNLIQNIIEKILYRGSYIQIAEQNEQLRNEIIQSERMKFIAVLASGMAHEIKNPLTPIKTFSEQLPSHLDDKEFLLKFSKIINKEVDRIDSLVQELLSFAKPSTPQLKPTNIFLIIEQTLDFLNNEIIRHKITLNTLFENKNLTINIDAQQIKQALLNIILNAIDAMPNGGTLIINSRIRENNNGVVVTIADTGCGIAPQDLPHIFDPFFSKKEKGTGLGLAITQGIIEKHGGKISIESKINQGTTFKIELPLYSSPLL